MATGEDLKVLAAPLALSAAGGAARLIMSRRKVSIPEFLRGIFIASFVGSLVAIGLNETQLSEGIRGAIVGLSAFLADDVLMACISVATTFRKDPFIFIGFFMPRLHEHIKKTKDKETDTSN